MTSPPRFLLATCPRDGVQHLQPLARARRRVTCPGCGEPFTAATDTFGAAEWAACQTVEVVIEYLLRCELEPSARKRRLLACAVCLRAQEELEDVGWKALQMVERFADGQAGESDLGAAAATVERMVQRGLSGRWMPGLNWILRLRSVVQPDVPLRADLLKPPVPPWPFDEDLALLREMVGNPFRPVVLEPGWLIWHGGTVRLLAEAIYTERTFDVMPILGDALEDAGCTDADLLAHCRQPTPHYRGCWLLDLLLGKT